MSQQQNKQKRALVLWSGGLDSTALIDRYITQGWLVDALPVTFPNSGPNKVQREAKARKAMYAEYFRDRGVTLVHSAGMHVQDFGDADFSQAVVWLNAAQWVCRSDRHDEVAVGYVMNDDAVSFLDDFQKLWRAHKFLWARTEKGMPPLKFPIVKIPKTKLFNDLPPILIKHLTWCESGFDEDFCGDCKPCKKAKDIGIQALVKQAIQEDAEMKRPKEDSKKVEVVEAIEIIEDEVVANNTVVNAAPLTIELGITDGGARPSYAQLGQEGRLKCACGHDEWRCPTAVKQRADHNAIFNDDTSYRLMARSL